jgi:hypothetical protein
MWIVVPESRIAEFLRGYWLIVNAAAWSIVFLTKNDDLTDLTHFIKSQSASFSLSPCRFLASRLISSLSVGSSLMLCSTNFWICGTGFHFSGAFFWKR